MSPSLDVRAARLRTSLVALSLLLAEWANAAPPVPLDLIDQLEIAPSVVVGTFESVEPLAHSAHLGRFRVEEQVAGGEPEQTTIELAWEEPGLTVPARFAPGHRALVALAPLPTASIWKTRIPDGARRAGVVAIGGGGAASLARPSRAEVDLLAHYLALAPGAKAGDAGTTRLAQLALIAEPGLARAAIARLGRAYAAASRPLPIEACDALAAVAGRSDAPAVTQDLVTWLARSRPSEVAVPLRSAIADAGAAAHVSQRAALAAIEDELDANLAAELVRSQDERARIIAARHARGDVGHALLPGLVASDPAPEVRAVALARWIEIGGVAALPEVERAFEDESPRVRSVAIEAVATLGEPALPELVAIARSGSPEAARSAVGALSVMGEPARAALIELAGAHEDEAIRTLARIALGVPIGHTHD